MNAPKRLLLLVALLALPVLACNAQELVFEPTGTPTMPLTITLFPILPETSTPN